MPRACTTVRPWGPSPARKRRSTAWNRCVASISPPPPPIRPLLFEKVRTWSMVSTSFGLWVNATASLASQNIRVVLSCDSKPARSVAEGTRQATRGDCTCRGYGLVAPDDGSRGPGRRGRASLAPGPAVRPIRAQGCSWSARPSACCAAAGAPGPPARRGSSGRRPAPAGTPRSCLGRWGRSAGRNHPSAPTTVSVRSRRTRKRGWRRHGGRRAHYQSG